MDSRILTLGVIPGLAPALVALLPQLIVLALVGMALVVSPRAWLRTLLAVLRHPLRSLAVAGGLAAATFLVSLAAARLPVPEARSAIPARLAGGFAYGDRLASRVGGEGSGPLIVPEAALLREVGESSLATLVPLSGEVVVLDRDGTRLRRVGTERGEAVWQIEPGRFLAAPLAFELADASATPPHVERFLAAVVERSAPPASSSLLVVDGADGSIVAEATLDVPPATPVATALIDDRFVIASTDSIGCFALTTPGLRPHRVWRHERTPRALVGLAGDEFGRFFALDDESLLAASLADGRLRELARFTPRAPRALALRDGLVYVLTRDDGGAALSCIDPALAGPQSHAEHGRRGVVWSVDVVSPIDYRIAIAPFGVVLAHAAGLEVLDRLQGEVLQRVPLDAPPVAVAVGEGSCFALLESDEVIRYSPSLERVEWRRSLPSRAGPAAEQGQASTGDRALALIGERLVVRRSGELFVLSEPPGSGDAPWGQWRGGSRRAGTADGAELPLLASVIWRSALTPNSAATSGSVEVLPAPVLSTQGGWIVLRSWEQRSILELFDKDGARSTSLALDGSARGIVRHGTRVLLAVERESGGRVLCLAVEEASRSLRELWSVPTAPLAASAALAVSRTDAIVSLRESLRVLSLRDGAERWESREIAGAQAPLVLSGHVYGPSPAPSVLVALELGDGGVVWRRTLPGRRWGLACGDGAALFVTTVSETDRPDESESAGSDSGEVRAALHRLAPTDGSSVWERPAGALPSKNPSALPLLADEDIILRDSSGVTRLFAIDDGGERRVDSNAGGVASGARAPSIAGLGAVILAGDDAVTCLDTLTLDVIWRVDVGARPEGMALDGERIALVAGDELICLGAR